MSILIIIIAFALCVYTAVTDVKRLEIDNWVSAALIGLFIVYGLLNPVLWAAHIVVMLVVLVLGIVINKAGIMGGGDIKILTALSLWAGLSHLPILLMATSLAGAIVASLTLALQKPNLIPLNIIPTQTGLAWVDGARAGGQTVAYGVAIAIGAACMFIQIGGL